MSHKEKFRKSLEEGYKKYLSIHTRSSEKIVPMHKCISEIILQELGRASKDFSIKSKGIDDGKEFNLSGQYYSKNIDITILYKGTPISGLGFKFITSNYKQNSNNYFENMLGETANVKRTDFLYGQILVFKHKMPYYSSDKKTFTKIEHINEENLLKYLKLHKDNAPALYHKPDIMYLGFVETGDEKAFETITMSYSKGEVKKIEKSKFHREQIKKVNVKFINPSGLKDSKFSTEMLDFLNKISDFDAFIEAFVNLTKGKTYSR